MISITLFSPACKTWTEEKCKNISWEIGICPACASIDTFQYLTTRYRWHWDITIPQNWTFGQWDQIKLAPVSIPLPVYSCTACSEKIKISPSFCLRGTRLTLQALAFIGFIYETTELTWRDLPEKLCAGNNKIAHSTLYKVVHSVGKLMATKQEIQKLHLQYQPPGDPAQMDPPSLWQPPKSIFTYTVAREKGLRFFLTNLLPGKTLHKKFLTYFYHWIHFSNRLFTKWNKTIPNIYSKTKPDP
jgi:hypothetical protein